MENATYEGFENVRRKFFGKRFTLEFQALIQKGRSLKLFEFYSISSLND